jgi:hypothetical protein
MRTTVDIDEDILLAVKELAKRQGSTAGKVLSELARRGLMVSRPRPARNGVPVLSSRGEVVTVEKLHRLADEEGV